MGKKFSDKNVNKFNSPRKPPKKEITSVKAKSHH
jgi:hypothetical protein